MDPAQQYHLMYSTTYQEPPMPQFDSGAVRSNDRNNVAYHLIDPIIANNIVYAYQDQFVANNETPTTTNLVTHLYDFLGAETRTSAHAYLQNALVELGELIEFETLDEDDNAYHKGAQVRDTSAGIYCVPMSLLRKIAEAYAEGAIKYGRFNCNKGFPIGDLINHALAHIFAYLNHKLYNTIPTEDDLGHAAWNIAQVFYMLHPTNTPKVKDHQLSPESFIHKAHT